jgi:hypothetical protein
MIRSHLAERAGTGKACLIMTIGQRGSCRLVRCIEEPPRMSSERDACLRKADEAKQRAAQATEPSIKSAYEKVAEHWMLLARLESLVAAEKNSEDA